MKIRIRLAGFFSGRLMHLEESVEAADGLPLKKFLRQADRSPAFKNHLSLKEIFRQKPPPTLLINGDPLLLPEGLDHRLTDGDEITIMTPLAGG